MASVFVERSDATQRIQAMAATAATELLDAYGVKLSEASTAWEETDELLYSGVMGFVGERVRGTCLLAAPRDTVLSTAPDGARPRDWAGELANQLVGRLKSKLMQHGVTIAVSTPVVLSGVKLYPLPRSEVAPSVFDTPSGRILVWLEVEVDPEFMLGSLRPLLAGEGEFLVF
jgi:CheY-specific phosphatase CheX